MLLELLMWLDHVISSNDRCAAVNKAVPPNLFSAYPTPEAMAG